MTLVLGALRMSQRHAIIKKLPSVETLGSVSVVCSDKTGTLTSNEMRVVKMYTVPDGMMDLAANQHPKLSHALDQCLLGGNLCNNATLNDQGKAQGFPTDVALMDVLKLFQRGDARRQWDRTDEVPFRSESRFMSVTVRTAKGPTQVFAKGAPEVILSQCTSYEGVEGSTALTKDVRTMIQRAADEMSQYGLRVIAMATGSPQARHSLTFCGLQAMHDPPREGVLESIESLQQGGVQVIMITGDSETTALAIARQLHLLQGSGSIGVMTGREVEQLSDRQLQDRVLSTAVFARTTPQHKMRIVAALQAGGAVVGMTGDGGALRDAMSTETSERCACAQACRRRYCDGPRRHRRCKGSR